MNDSKKTSADILEVLDNALTAALKEVRRARAKRPVSELAIQKSTSKRTSNVVLCIDVLSETGHPLHVTSLLEALNKLGIQTSRDSLVSALLKKVTPNGPFIRTAPNTFGLAIRDRPLEE